ncbi:DUF2621 family protein [Desertibacillus haloalkaliphilus]|uniref:DUF2621 family protein n=1 Tax=Desertibacillus haloalkaliphilus TaxID=1328930 RepID=UPI001C26BD48|nr:DUF2621 family protein [Desertibacillus haloalkaliphilus]MBU8906778.1 DUF2621 domain-containing protein [Desertibacillus haloalkaliphilus]
MNWNEDAKAFLEELVEPIPVFVRPMAKKGIEKKITELAEGDEITKEDVIRGYILGSTGKMQQKAIETLKSKDIDLTPYEDLLP